MRRIYLWLTLVVVIVMAQLIATAPIQRSLRAQLNPNYVRAMAAYRKLEPRLPREELRAITTIGIMNGAQEAERKMEQHLVEVVKDLVLNTDMTDEDEVVPKIERIEKQLARDHRALTILTSAMDLVTGTKDVRDFRADMQQIRRQSNAEQHTVDGANGAAPAEAQGEEEKDLSGRVAALRRNILQQVNAMKALVDQKIEHTLDYLIDEADENGLLAKASNKVVRKRNAGAHEEREVPAEIRMIKSILTEDDFRNNLVDVGMEKRNDLFESLEEELMPPPAPQSKNVIANRSSSSNTTNVRRRTKTTTTAKPTRQLAAISDAEVTSVATTTTTTRNTKAAAETTATTFDLDGTELAKQEESSSEVAPEGGGGNGGGGGGGLVGIISSLSGGEGGSDIGALIGALTGVISTLFGPNGLDIESLISTATSLISGLLSGNKNFGTILGTYVGTAFDGLSGGGGAVNNGQFIGNFLGTVVASLSADPEEDDAPLRPLLFAQNVISSFLEAKNRKASGEETEERKGGAEHHTHSAHTHSAHTTNQKGEGGSDSAGFIKHIVSHLVGSAISLVLNASLGASGGASHASASLFTGSSHKHDAGAGDGGHGGGGGVKSW